MFKKPTLTQFYAIFSLINVQKYFAWLSFRSFPAGMPIFSQIRVGHVTWEGDSLVHPLLRGHSQMTSAERGREGGYPITDAVREVA